jgi:hypothetical protein
MGEWRVAWALLLKKALCGAQIQEASSPSGVQMAMLLLLKPPCLHLCHAGKDIALAYLAYGNEHSIQTVYASMCILVTIPRARERMPR